MIQPATQYIAEGIRVEHQVLPAVSADPKIENEALAESEYDLTVQEVAERLGVSAKAAQALVRAALQKH
jgi:predicted DNA-binding protein (UPF0251 family)